MKKIHHSLKHLQNVISDLYNWSNIGLTTPLPAQTTEGKCHVYIADDILDMRVVEKAVPWEKGKLG